MNTKRIGVLFALAVLLAGITLVASVVWAEPGLVSGPNFEIDGNTAQDDPDADDWETVITGAPYWDGGPGILILDGSSGPKAIVDELDTFAKGGKFGDPTSWIIEAGNSPAQNDLTNVYVYPVLPDQSQDGNTWMVMGMERIKKQGTFDLDFEYNQVPWDGTSGTLVRTEGDLLVGFELSGNPEDPEADLEVLIALYDPLDLDCTGEPEYTAVYGDGWCEVFRGPASALFGTSEATMNAVAFPVPPWGSYESSGAPLEPGVDDIEAFFFAEAAINLTEMGIEPGCPGFGSVHAKSRSSLEVTADLKDLAGPRTLPIACGLYGYKYKDVNGNGIVPDDSDSPLTGWTIELYDDANALVATTTTDVNGRYEFTALSDGTYSVMEVCETGWAQTYPVPTDGCGSGTHSGIVIDVFHTYEGPYDFGNAQGSTIVRKEDAYGALLSGAGFTFDPNPFDGSAAIEILDGGGDDQANGDDGILCIDGVVLDTYQVTETQAPGGYAPDPDPQTVVVDSSSTCADRLGDTDTPDATFVNRLGSIIIRKEAKDKSAEGGIALLGGAGFTFKPNPFDGGAEIEILDGGVDDQAIGADGILCIDDVLLGNYNVSETTVPLNYQGDPDTELVAVSSASTCADRLGGIYTPDAMFVNVPLSEIVITFNSLGGDGVTVATSVICTGPSTDGTEQGPLDDAESATFTDLLPGSYNCIIVVDP